MGVLNGTLSYMRYFVEGHPPEDREQMIERMQLYAIRELTPDQEDEQVIGWSQLNNVLQTEFNQAEVFHNEYALFSLRIDSWKIPSALLKAHQTEAERVYMEEQGREKLGKHERTQIKEAVRKRLKTRLLPNLAAYDVCWQIDEQLLRFWSLSKGANEAFVDMFEKTFQLSLVPQTPYTLAERCGFDEDSLALMATLEPQAFAKIESFE